MPYKRENATIGAVVVAASAVAYTALKRAGIYWLTHMRCAYSAEISERGG